MASFTNGTTPPMKRRGLAVAVGAARCSGYVQRKGVGFIGAHSYKRRYMELRRDTDGLGPTLVVYRRYGGKACGKTVLDGYHKISMPSGKKQGKHCYFEIAHSSRTARRFRVENEEQRKKWMDGISMALKEHDDAMTPELRKRIDSFLKQGNADAEEEEEEEDEAAEAPGGGGALDDATALREAVEDVDAASPRTRAQTGEDFEAAHRALLETRHRSRRVRRSFKDRSAEGLPDARETSDASDDDEDDDEEEAAGDWCEWKTYVCEKTGHAYFMNEAGEAYWGPTVLHAASDSPWEARVDNATGATYYFNVQTEVSQWERPEDYSPPGDAPAQAQAEAEAEAEAAVAVAPEAATNNAVHHHSEAQRPHALPGLAKADSHMALPGTTAAGARPKEAPRCPWEARVDPTHDAIYYYNTVTEASKWEKPADYVPPPN